MEEIERRLEGKAGDESKGSLFRSRVLWSSERKDRWALVARPTESGPRYSRCTRAFECYQSCLEPGSEEHLQVISRISTDVGVYSLCYDLQ